MVPGTRVRLADDPGRIGVITGKSRMRGDLISWQIQFPDLAQYVPVDQIEILPDNAEDPIDLFAEGKFGRAVDLRRTLTHVRLGGKLANLLYSMETTNTDFLAYQFKPIIKLLNSPTKGILIADEVGLGKTIEAGLIWTELRSRYDYRRLVVVCPAFLREKWKRELANRFGVEARIVDAAAMHEVLKSARNESNGRGFAVIGSYQGLRPLKGFDQEDSRDRKAQNRLARFLQQNEYGEPLVDLLIFDEAHYLRKPDPKKSKKTAILGQFLRNISENIVLLSATPIQLRSQDLYQLLNIVDEATFNQPRVFEQILQANEPLIRARDAVITRQVTQSELKSMLEQAQSNALLGDSKQLAELIAEPPTDEELRDHSRRLELAYRLETINLSGHVVTRTRRKEVQELYVKRFAVPEAVKMTDAEREFYGKTTAAIRTLCKKHASHEGFLLMMPQRQMSSSMPAALRDWQRRGGVDIRDVEDEQGEEIEIEDEEQGIVVTELIMLAQETNNLDELWNHDSKYKRFKEVIVDGYLREHPHSKVVVFSYFRATLDYLQERLQSDGVSSIVLKGGAEQDKESIIDEFAKQEGPSILLSSEVGSEGIDLQFSSVIVNYDLPWNPMRVEQRIGRVDRIGQQSTKIWIWNLFYADTIDSRIYERLYTRINIFEGSIGILEPILGGEIRRLSIELMREDLTPAEEETKIDSTAIALVNRRQLEEKLEEQAAQLVKYGDYILNQVKAARELHRWVSGNDIASYVIGFFNMFYTGCEFQKKPTAELDYDIQLSNEAKNALEDFIRKRQLRESTNLVRNDPRPVSFRFVNRVIVDTRSGVEIINQIHPVVRFVNAMAEERLEFYHPTVAVRVTRSARLGHLNHGQYAFVVQRWTAEGIQDTEQLHYVAAAIDGDGLAIDREEAELLITSALEDGTDWPESGTMIDLKKAFKIIDGCCLEEAEKDFRTHSKQLRNQNDDRANLQLKTLQLHLEMQRKILGQVKQDHILKNRPSLAKATEERLRKIEQGIERKKLAIDDRKGLRLRKQEICAGVIRIE